MHSGVRVKRKAVGCWGRDFAQPLSTGEKVLPVPTKVLGITDAVSVSVGALPACALLNNGKVRCLGGEPRRSAGPGNVGGDDVGVADVMGL